MEELSWSMTSIIGLSSSYTKERWLLSWGNGSFPSSPLPLSRTWKQNSVQDRDKGFLTGNWVSRWWMAVDKTLYASELSLWSFSGRQLELPFHIALRRHAPEFQQFIHVHKNLNTVPDVIHWSTGVVINFKDWKPHKNMLCLISKMLLTEVTDLLK